MKMYPTDLPNEAYSTYCPSGMLDRDQRTTLTIKRTTNIPTQNPSTRQSQLNLKNIQTSADNSKCQNMDNINDTSGCLSTKFNRPIGFNRSRTKSVGVFQILILIWICTFYHSCAAPISNSDSSCEAIKSCNTMTTHSLKNLEATLDEFRDASNMSEEVWGNAGYDNGQYYTENITKLFADENLPSKEEMKNKLKSIYDDLQSKVMAFNYFVYRHNHPDKSTFYFKNNTNSIISNFFNTSVNENAKSLLWHMHDISQESEYDFPEPNVNDLRLEWNEQDLLLFEYKSIVAYQDILKFSQAFTDYVYSKLC